MKGWIGEPVCELVLFEVGIRQDNEGGQKRRNRIDATVFDGIPNLQQSVMRQPIRTERPNLSTGSLDHGRLVHVLEVLQGIHVPNDAFRPDGPEGRTGFISSAMVNVRKRKNQKGRPTCCSRGHCPGSACDCWTRGCRRGVRRDPGRHAPSRRACHSRVWSRREPCRTAALSRM